jgi:hypothetical protein
VLLLCRFIFRIYSHLIHLANTQSNVVNQYSFFFSSRVQYKETYKKNQDMAAERRAKFSKALEEKEARKAARTQQL